MTRRWLTEEHLANLPRAMTERALSGTAKSKRSGAQSEHMQMTAAPSKPVANGGMQAMQALGRMAKGKMNKTEEAYNAHLELRRIAGEVLWYHFEPLKLHLAPNTSYTPDFLVQLASGHLEIHETKGFWTDDARVKIKVAASMFPVFKFVAIKMVKVKGAAPSWSTEEF